MSSSILFPTNEYTTSSKSSQEIQKLMMPEQTQLETLLFILTKAHPLQLPYAYRSYHQYPDETLALVLPRLSTEEHETQILIVESLKKITPQLFVPHAPAIFDSLLDALRNWSTINNQHLVEAVQYTIELSSHKSELLQKLQQVALAMGKPTEPIISKVMAGMIVPILAKYRERSLKGELMDIIKRIIADSEAEAKKVFLQEIFPKLLRNLRLDFIEIYLQEKIYEMVYDENEEIGLMALELILRNATRFSLEEQSSRIVKLFIDSLTSKNEKIATLVTSFMGETYHKLQGIILKSEHNCIKLWKSLIEVAESKNEKILNNFIFNLPGILLLAKNHHRVDPLCEVYTELFFNPDADSLLLASYFHEIAQMFPSRRRLLRDTAYNLFQEIFEEAEPAEDSVRIADCMFIHLYESRGVYLESGTDSKQEEDTFTSKTLNDIRAPYFDATFNDILIKYLNLCFNKKNGKYIGSLFASIEKCMELFSPCFTESILLPKLYSAIRSKSVYLDSLIKLIVAFLARESSSVALINNYASKINVELSKSTRAHQRQAALLFFYYASFEFSIDTFQEFKMGEKFLQFNTDKSLKNKLLFIQSLPHIAYFFTRQEKIEYTIILNRLRKDPDPEVLRAIESTSFVQTEEEKAAILEKSRLIKEKEKMRSTLNVKKPPYRNRRDLTKDLRKDDVLKKRLETRSRTKVLIKQLPKKRTPMAMSRPPRKTQVS